MRLNIIEDYDGSFTLDPAVKAHLFELLRSVAFRAQIAQASGCSAVEFTELLFQPVPYSTHTPKGMPPLFEPYLASSEYTIVNVPPNFMFQAKVFKPSRLCAVYRCIQMS